MALARFAAAIGSNTHSHTAYTPTAPEDIVVGARAYAHLCGVAFRR